MNNELRCKEKHTRMMDVAKPVWAETLGIEVVSDEKVPEDMVQLWRDGELVAEIPIEEG